jgi:hypothetical protein
MKEERIAFLYTPSNVSLELTVCDFLLLPRLSFGGGGGWLVIAITHILLFVLLLLLFLFGFLLFLVLLALFFRLNRQLVLDVILVTVQNGQSASLGSVLQRVLCQKKEGRVVH